MQRIERQSLSVRGSSKHAFQSILFSQTDSFSFDQGQGRLLTEQVRLGNSGIRVGRVQSTGHRIALKEEQHVTILFPKAGSLAVRIGRNEAMIAAGQCGRLVPAPRSTHARAVAGQFAALVLMIPKDGMAGIAAEAGIGAFLARDMQAESGHRARRMAAYLEFLLSDLDSRGPADDPAERTVDGMVALLRDLLADWLADAAETGPTGGNSWSGVDLQRVRRAEEIERSDDALPVASVARELGVSLRGFQAAFHHVLGERPKARLTRIRLERARARLLQAEPEEQVTGIALDCGFTHLSRFAEVYLQSFGERPSETLARRRRPSPRR